MDTPDLRSRISILVIGVVLLGIIGFGVAKVSLIISPSSVGAAAALVTSPFLYTFNSNGIVNEAGNINESWSPYWWINSGGKMIIENGVGETIQGSLPPLDPWRIVYLADNPIDTDNGFHPQNIFRLLTRQTWNNIRVETSFFVAGDNFSSSTNRNASNGLLLMSRYQLGGQTLYYAGIRVDGLAVIKKKYTGTYFTMAQKQIFPGSYPAYQTTANLLPHNEWIKLKSETVTDTSGVVTVSLYMMRGSETAWTLLLSAKDDGKVFGGTPPITQNGYVGIRTDFMDVKFDNFRLENI